MAHEQPSTLARYLFVAYVLLVVYASLHPFSGWRDRGLPPFAFVAAPFTRPMPVFDVVVNVIGYVPLGFLAALAAYPRLRGGRAFVFGFACSLLLSFTLESLQLYLPTRTSSNLDLLANAAGGALGALAAVAGTRALRLEEGLLRLRERFMLPGRRIDLGLVLLPATAIFNSPPANPYLTATLSLWQQGHYLNLNGVTRVVSAAWPFAAMFYLVLLATAHERTRI